MADDDRLRQAIDITRAWLANPLTHVTAESAPALLAELYRTLGDLGAAPPAMPDPPDHKGAVSPRASLASPDYIVSMIDGRRYRSLTRHLKAKGLTPDEYRTRYGLKPDYPMVAPAYSERRRAAALSAGLAERAASARAAKANLPPGQPRKGIAAAKKAAKAHLGNED